MSNTNKSGHVNDVQVTLSPAIWGSFIGVPRLADLKAKIMLPKGMSIHEACLAANRALSGAFAGLPKTPAPRPVRVLCDGPATIVFWSDGEKTVVKCRECKMHEMAGSCAAACRFKGCKRNYYDHEKAVMAAMLKRLAPGWQDDLREIEKEGN